MSVRDPEAEIVDRYDARSARFRSAAERKRHYIPAPETMTAAGAQEIAIKILGYYQRHGLKLPNVMIIPFAMQRAGARDERLHVVRSDLRFVFPRAR